MQSTAYTVFRRLLKRGLITNKRVEQSLAQAIQSPLIIVGEDAVNEWFSFRKENADEIVESMSESIKRGETIIEHMMFDSIFVSLPNVFYFIDKSRESTRVIRGASDDEFDLMEFEFCKESLDKVRIHYICVANEMYEGHHAIREVMDFNQFSFAEPATLALTIVQWLQDPNNHVIELCAEANPRPRKVRKSECDGKASIPKPLSERVRHIILPRETLVSKWKSAHGGTHAPPIPHFRRGHWRRYLDERYKKAWGKRVWIKPTKVGDPEITWEEAGLKYKVVA